ncbi:hypothetical protein [Streptomyces sp. SudanB52_2052]|uniref:hypothetical protein n=1 Tax=Streptomyces sp. SudanB52_2052 TaxID=3035276 RepID=UPI003F57065E
MSGTASTLTWSLSPRASPPATPSPPFITTDDQLRRLVADMASTTQLLTADPAARAGAHEALETAYALLSGLIAIHERHADDHAAPARPVLLETHRV